MSKSPKRAQQMVSIDQLIHNFRQHPSMLQVEILKDQLKQEKRNDRIFYHSIKEEIATRQ